VALIAPWHWWSGAARALGAAAFATAAWLTAPLAESGSLAAPRAFAPYQGALLHLQRGAIWQFDLATEEDHIFLQSDTGLITYLAYSPDRLQLAYSVLYLNQRYEVVASEIVISAADRSSSRTILREEGSGSVITWPAWNRDGSAVGFTVSSLLDKSERVDQMDLLSGARQTLVDGGSSVAISGDDQWLAYDHLSTRGWSIWTLNRATGTNTQVASESWFGDADVPSFSPVDGTLAFVATGSGPPQASRLLGLPPPIAVAEAHDVADPFDLWEVRPDGSELHRVAVLQNLQPFLAWSPDGRHLAVWGGRGLQIVDTSNQLVREVTNSILGGPMSWGN
jgi:Tol biopolymer transport system component